MTNANHHVLRGLIQVPLAVLPLLALLLVFLSSIGLQQAPAAGVADQGYTGTPDLLVVASHDASFRALSGKLKKSTAAESEEDFPDSWPYWPYYSMALSAGLLSKTRIINAHAGQLPANPRFLIPLLRAPPLA